MSHVPEEVLKVLAMWLSGNQEDYLVSLLDGRTFIPDT